jgi:hypothetical protein
MMRTEGTPARTVRNREKSVSTGPAEAAKIGKKLNQKP